MVLCTKETGTILREATFEEYQQSMMAAMEDGGEGVIIVDELRCYVEGEPLTCDNPDCSGGYVDAGDYVAHTGEVCTRYIPCSECYRLNTTEEEVMF